MTETHYKAPTVASLLESHGSFRRLCEAYWLGTLTPEEERLVEERHPTSELTSYKPIEPRTCDRMHVSDLPPAPDFMERKYVVFFSTEQMNAMLAEGWQCESVPCKIGDTVEMRRLKPFEVHR